MITRLNARGLTLIEMLIAIVLLGASVGLLHRVLSSTRHANQRQIQLAQVNSTLRTAVSILEPVIQELNAGDPAGSDIISITPTVLTIKTTKSAHFLCRPPDPVTKTIWVGEAPAFGDGNFANVDSIFLFSEGDPLTRNDDRWLHAAVTSSNTGFACPAGAASISIDLGGVTSQSLDSVYVGAPVRAFGVSEFGLYAEDGDWWLGTRQFVGGAWLPYEMLVGPMATGGLQFLYFDVAGVLTANPAEVVRAAVYLNGLTSIPVSEGSGFKDRATVSLTSQVSLRNNPRF